MEATELEVGKWYWVIGYGKCRVTRLPKPPRKTTASVVSAAGFTYTFEPRWFLREVEAPGDGDQETA